MAFTKKHESLPTQAPKYLESRGQMGFPQEVEGNTFTNAGRCSSTIDRPLHFPKSPVGSLNRVGGRWEELFVEEDQSPSTVGAESFLSNRDNFLNRATRCLSLASLF